MYQENAVASDPNGPVASAENACVDPSSAGPQLTFFEASDADELAEHVRHWKARLTQLHPGPFHGRLACLDLGPLSFVHSELSAPLMMHLETPADRITFTRKTQDSAPNRISGHDFQPGECALSGPRTEGVSVSRGRIVSNGLSIPLELWNAGAHWLGESKLPHARGVRFPTPGEAWVANFISRVDCIFLSLKYLPAGPAAAGIVGVLTDSLVSYVNTLGHADVPMSDSRDARIFRRIAVERARAYIDERLTDQIRLSDLCTYARTQARSLEYGFQETVGMSPIAYVRTMRLHRARRELRTIAGTSRSISEIAMDCGFWHLSQFAVDYKAMFGESPSVTLKRAAVQQPTPERRRHAVRRDGTGVSLAFLA